ncbi:MAG: nucleotidyltransferase domain-containing protein [bacterium]|nr:nucleotidyltransferase domain-containing protein [bacterium]
MRCCHKVYYSTLEEREKIIGRLTDFIRGYQEVSFAYIYGSFLEEIPFHDIDLGIYVTGIKEEDSTIYALELTQAISRVGRIPIDIRVLNYVPLPFLYHVFKGQLIFERDEDIRIDITHKTLQRYLDIKPMLRRGIKEAFSV